VSQRVAVCCNVLQMCKLSVESWHLHSSKSVHGCCSVLQGGTVQSSVLQCVAGCRSLCYSVLQMCSSSFESWHLHFSKSEHVCCSVLACVAVCCSVLQCTAVCCSVLQCTAVCCSVLQCVAEGYSVLHWPNWSLKSLLQHAATHCTTPL